MWELDRPGRRDGWDPGALGAEYLSRKDFYGHWLSPLPLKKRKLGDKERSDSPKCPEQMAMEQGLEFSSLGFWLGPAPRTGSVKVLSCS